MFNLEQCIAEWRKQILAAGIKTPVPLEELEIHLREEIERRMKSGLSEQPAFETAIQKIGTANLLNNEFEKVQGTKERRDWKLILFLASLSFFSSLIAALLVFKIGNMKELTTAQQMSGLAALAATILLAVGGRLLHRIFPVIGNKRIRDVVCISVGALAALFEIIFSMSSWRALISQWAN